MNITSRRSRDGPCRSGRETRAARRGGQRKERPTSPSQGDNGQAAVTTLIKPLPNPLVAGLAAAAFVRPQGLSALDGGVCHNSARRRRHQKSRASCAASRMDDYFVGGLFEVGAPFWRPLEEGGPLLTLIDQMVNSHGQLLEEWKARAKAWFSRSLSEAMGEVGICCI